MNFLHDWTGLVFGIIIVVHLLIHWRWFLAKFKKVLKNIKENKSLKISKRGKRKYKLTLAILLVISFLLVYITGIIKLPAVIARQDVLYYLSIYILILHDWSGVSFGSLVIIHIVLHRRWIINTTKTFFRKSKVQNALLLIIVIAIRSILITPLILPTAPAPNDEGTIIIELTGTFKFNPNQIERTRPDIFRECHFSIFDILVNLDKRGEIDMEYHFDDSMKSHVIDSINGRNYWWHYSYYDGGWSEESVYRLDHYPYKPKMYIRLHLTTEDKLERIYDT
jgi:hypothetical protein